MIETHAEPAGIRCVSCKSGAFRQVFSQHLWPNICPCSMMLGIRSVRIIERQESAAVSTHTETPETAGIRFYCGKMC